MKYIELTQGQVAIVDNKNYEELNKFKWYAHWSKFTQSYYAVRNEGKNPRKTIFMHRQIMNTPKDMLCDHKDHNTLFNLEKNLRNATKSQNTMNSKLRSDNKLGERCIVRFNTGFRVQVHSNKRLVFRKWFKTIEEARIARNKAIKKHHGKYALGEL